jgi:predicted helicase
MIDNRIFVSSKGIAYFFPLYLYKENKKAPNFTEGFRKYIKELYGKELSPEEIFYYIYAVLYSPSYREKFGEFLKYEFPRIPFPKELKSFKELSQVGKKLCELHLLKDVSPSSIKLVGENFKVEKVSFKKNRVYINETTCFEPVEKEVFSYKIGGYQVLKKWLKDRKGRELSFEEINTYRAIIQAITKTIDIQEKRLSRLVQFDKF